jgi:hypothetical protein
MLFERNTVMNGLITTDIVKAKSLREAQMAAKANEIITIKEEHPIGDFIVTLTVRTIGSNGEFRPLSMRYAGLTPHQAIDQYLTDIKGRYEVNSIKNVVEMSQTH